MKFTSPSARRYSLALSVVALLLAPGCHRSVEWEPLVNQKVYVSDKFFDIALLGPDQATVIGYGGKIITTDDSGRSWNLIDSGTDQALFSIDFAADKKVGWIVGQDGLILKTTDGGRTWARQPAEIWRNPKCQDSEERQRRRLEGEECQQAYLFAVSVIDDDNAVAIGDRSIFTRTRDGGKTWQTVTIKLINENIDPDMLIAFEDPVLYDVEFLDLNNGYIVGEFGKIYHTTDGGTHWVEQEDTLMDETVFDVLDLPTLFDVEFLDRKHGIAAGLDGRIATTDDGGKDWNFVASNVSEYVDPFYAATILPNGDRWVVGSSGQVAVSKAWGDFTRGDLGSAIYNWMGRIRFYDQNHGWIVGGFGLLLNTNDGGKTWYRRIG